MWRTYYGAMFNPARVNPRAMKRELPVRHWPTLPEATLIPSLLAEAPVRVEQMMANPSPATSARPFIPEAAPLEELRRSAVLRADDPAHGDEIYKWLVADLRLAASSERLQPSGGSMMPPEP